MSRPAPCRTQRVPAQCERPRSRGKPTAGAPGGPLRHIPSHPHACFHGGLWQKWHKKGVPPCFLCAESFKTRRQHRAHLKTEHNLTKESLLPAAAKMGYLVCTLLGLVEAGCRGVSFEGLPPLPGPRPRVALANLRRPGCPRRAHHGSLSRPSRDNGRGLGPRSARPAAPTNAPSAQSASGPRTVDSIATCATCTRVSTRHHIEVETKLGEPFRSHQGVLLLRRPHAEGRAQGSIYPNTFHTRPPHLPTRPTHAN